jgi:hypothetical protein
MCIRLPTDGKIWSPCTHQEGVLGRWDTTHSFLTSALYVVEWSALGFGRFISGTHLTGDFVDPAAGLNASHGEQYLVLLLQTENILVRSGCSVDPIVTELSERPGNKLLASVSVHKHVHQLICWY